MRNRFQQIQIGALLLGTLQIPTFAQAVAAGRDRHVVVISIDGFPAYALRDSTLPLPALRRLIAEGGVAEGLKPVNPTVTWPNHTAMITGVNAARHGVIFNGLPVRGGEGKALRVNGRIPKSELVLSRTVYDAAHDAGLTTAEVAWVAIGRAASIDWSFPESQQADSPMMREMLEQGVITKEELQSSSRRTTYHDEMRIRAAVHIIQKHRPNLLLLHLLTTDDVQHTYGARSLAAEASLVLADRHVQRVLDAIDRAGIRDATTVLVVSDHGFKTYQHLIYPNALLRQRGLIRDIGGQLDCDAWTLSEGGVAMVYITRESKREATLKVLKEAFTHVPGVARVIWPDDYSAHGYPKVTSQGRMSELMIEAAPGYCFQERVTTGDVVVDVPPGGDSGTHGYSNSDPDMDAILVAWGAGIQPGSRAGIVPNVNVASTIAQLLKLNFTGIQGTPLVELLSK